ncbi:uncharacterized protein LOC142354691 isoform X2 [Convolutriloba macropyga]|uniref:uncharacterized protein LOC142354691 isoform X2 n=1 Tax=Convolutriloba macropyga TaxID=536237 RepID=UPI003F51DF30
MGSIWKEQTLLILAVTTAWSCILIPVNGETKTSSDIIPRNDGIVEKRGIVLDEEQPTQGEYYYQFQKSFDFPLYENQQLALQPPPGTEAHQRRPVGTAKTVRKQSHQRSWGTTNYQSSARAANQRGQAQSLDQAPVPVQPINYRTGDFQLPKRLALFDAGDEKKDSCSECYWRSPHWN